ncbi:recombinase family protein [Pseudooceanicola atlanticus]|uniref:recombinase family protein n=1 Tax=Pseudooceanicola atlanticus TaxID=1461694 RepID=UPI0009DD7B86|nr:recombinase family protein [Pseudooceanicola atlanticus]
MSTGDRIIDPDQAAIVQQVFERYAMGESARTIAARLNAEHLPGPRGGTWSFSTISGNWKRSTGLLNNELNIGRLAVYQQSYTPDPLMGKRQARPTPPTPLSSRHLRILRCGLHHGQRLALQLLNCTQQVTCNNRKTIPRTEIEEPVLGR